MKNLLTKLWKEVGISFVIWIPIIIIDLIKVNFFSKVSDVSDDISADITTIKNMSNTERSNLLKFHENRRKVDLTHTFNQIFTRIDDNTKWNKVADFLWILSKFEIDSTWDYQLNTLKEKLDAKEDSYFRYHKLNKGKNDYWEWYLTPWHRTYSRLIVAMSNPRLVSVLSSVYERYNKWYDENPWMLRVVIGSNIGGIASAYALHALRQYITTDDSKYLDDYKRWSLKYHKVLINNFDSSGFITSPNEGLLYGGFLLGGSSLLLSLVQHKFKFRYQILKLNQVQEYPKFVWLGQTSENEFQTLGDGKSDYNQVVLYNTIHWPLAYLHHNVYSKKLINGNKDWLVESILQ